METDLPPRWRLVSILYDSWTGYTVTITKSSRDLQERKTIAVAQRKWELAFEQARALAFGDTDGQTKTR